jgi:N-acetylglucosamine kinase-like BadF-type ATPase
VRVRYSYAMRCVLGFDGGGTKTDCVLMDETGALLARALVRGMDEAETEGK